MISDGCSFGGLIAEMSSADFEDGRLLGRLVSCISALSAKPTEGFPQIFKTPAELEGWYRFLRNPRVEPDEILQPHVEATCARAEAEPLVLVIHDTTIFSFPLEDERREGLYKINNVSQGFLGHFALAATMEDCSRPLGILGLDTFIRRDRGTGSKATGKVKKNKGERERWSKSVNRVSDYFESKQKLIHVMDREADDYNILTDMVMGNHRFVIRAWHDRTLSTSKTTKLFEWITKSPRVCSRVVRLSSRREPYFLVARKRHPKRTGRKAKLDIYAISADVVCPAGSKSFSTSLNLNIVYVKERDCPAGESPVEWTLLTTEKIDTPSEVAWVVDVYRKRWLIEEYFKSLKTGCAYEKRQLESRKTLEAALAVLVPVAWRLLLLRTLGRHNPNKSAESVLNKVQIDLLRKQSKKRLPSQLSAKQAMQEVASLGGHIKNNGPPGWLVLGRGLDNLLWMEIGWRSAMEAATQRCDQS